MLQEFLSDEFIHMAVASSIFFIIISFVVRNARSKMLFGGAMRS
jgi:hypothetical protein